jgi:hypothetical protein
MGSIQYSDKLRSVREAAHNSCNSRLIQKLTEENVVKRIMHPEFPAVKFFSMHVKACEYSPRKCR